MNSQEEEYSEKKSRVTKITPDKYLDFMSAAALYILYTVITFMIMSSSFMTKRQTIDNLKLEVELWKNMNLPKHAQPDYSNDDDCEARMSFVVILANETNSIEIKSDNAPSE